jgi:hypothetical protein
LKVFAKPETHMRKTPSRNTPETAPGAGGGPTFAGQLPAALLNAFNTNDRINQYLIGNGEWGSR